MGSGASIPERLSLDDAKALVPSESWVDAWEQTYFVGGDGAVAEPKTVSRAKAERLWAKAERGVAALSQPGFERSVAGPPAYESDRVLPRCGAKRGAAATASGMTKARRVQVVTL